ncbi:MAG: hypothetical protein LBT07_00360 [Endomicrobium sp.]|jgi:hypothetical protein|nr:hypothetical protein [Endomicrobium sp.]
MFKYEKEVYTGNIKRIIHKYYHFYYDGYDNGKTHKNCKLYAVKRLMNHLGQTGKISKDLWYEHSDKELRKMVANISGDPERRRSK